MSKALLELSAGKGESIELSSSAKRNIKMKPLNKAVVKEIQSTAIQEESQTGVSKQ